MQQQRPPWRRAEEVSIEPFEVYSEVTAALASGADEQDVVRRALAAIGERLGWHLGIVFEAQAPKDVLRPTVFWRGAGMEAVLPDAELAALRLDRDEGRTGRAWREDGVVFRRGRAMDGRWAPGRLADAGLRSMIVFPITSAQAVNGVVAMVSRDDRPSSSDSRETWEALGRQLGQYFERRRAECSPGEAVPRLLDEPGERVAEHASLLEAEIADHGRAESEVNASESRYQALFQSKSIGFIVADFKGRILDANDEYLRIVGCDRVELEQGLVEWRQLTPPEWLPADDAAVDQLRRLGYMAPYLKEYQRRDGSRVPVVIGATLLDRDRGQCVCFVLDDTLRRKGENMLADANRNLERRVRRRTASLKASELRAKRIARTLAASERRLRTLAAHLQTVREEERTRLAREIHDVLGQELTGLKMDVAWIGRRLKEVADGREGSVPALAHIVERLESMQAQIESGIGTVRRIATDLRPAVLDDLGLVSALEWQTREYERRSGLTATLDAPRPDLIVEGPLATALFRIFQELLTNIARHAQASRVAVRLEASQATLVLEVRDDGRGIVLAESTSVRSLGLLGIRERATALGGTFVIEGAPGKGTVARVALPRPSVSGP